MLERLAHLIARKRWYVIGVWLALTLFGGFAAGQVSKRWFQSFSIPGKSAYEANQRTLNNFGTGVRPSERRRVPHERRRDDERCDQAGDDSRGEGVARSPARARFFSTNNSMYVSRDKHTTFEEVYPGRLAKFDTKSGVDKMEAAAKRGLPAGITVNVTGHDPLEKHRRTAAATGRASSSKA